MTEENEGTLIDYTEGTIYKGVKSSIKVCHHCPREEYSTGKPVLPNTPDYINSKITPSGEFICGTCVTTDKVKTDVKLFGPHDRSTAGYVNREQRRVDDWNRLVDEARAKGNITYLRKKRNVYQNEIDHYWQRIKKLK